MRRSVEDTDSDSERSSDGESNFKRRGKKRARKDDTNDSVDSSSCKSKDRAWEEFRRKAVRSLRTTAEFANGVTAIPCPVITKKLPEIKLKYESPLPTVPVQTTVISSVGKSNVALANEDKLIRMAGGISFRSSATDIMKQMGFDASKGLGRTMNPCELAISTQEQMETMLQAAGITVENNTLNFNEECPLEENVHWIKPVFPLHSTDYTALSEWRKVGKQKTSIRDESTLIDPDTLKEVLDLRKCLNVMNMYDYMQVRARSNPFESLSKGPFLCRAALKMANLDATLSYALTQPTTNSADRVSAVGPNELFYFADVCAGPGGFTEYILCKKKWECKGYGMTLKNHLDFDLWSSTVANAENFESIYGPAGDGDVYNPSNTTEFIKYIKYATDGRGVHLMMADGGFDVEDKEMQEILSAQIYLSQCYLALALVRTGGMFVVKLFDTLTPFTIGLIYLMYISFDLVSLHKPNTSRPANSERYLICKWKRLDTDGVCSYLAHCYSWFWEMRIHNERDPNNVQAITELVPFDIIADNKDFYDYIWQSNTRMAQQQIENLKKMVIFSRDPNLRDPRQEKIKRKLFETWKISQFTPKVISLKGPDQAFKDVFGTMTNEDFLQCNEYSLQEHNLEMFIRSPFDWRIVVVGGTEHECNRGFYMSLGRDRVYRYHNKKSTWVRIEERLELSRGTLVYAEIVDEVYGKKANQRIGRTFHIIDAMFLGGIDVRSKHYTARLEICIKFAKSMNKPTNPELCEVRTKIPVRMENIADVLGRLENRVIAGSGTNSQLVCPVDHTDETLPFIRPVGILFLKITKEPWTMALSRSSNRKYYFNLSTAESSFDLVMESISEFEYAMQHRLIWWWDKEISTILSTQDVTDVSRAVTTSQDVLNPRRLLHYIESAWQQNRTA